MKHEVSPRLASVLLACTPFLAWATPVRAAEPERYDVDATIDRGGGIVAADVTIRVHVEDGEESVVLWLYADRLAVPPSPMEERSWRWIFPGEVDLGGVTLTDISVDDAQARR